LGITNQAEKLEEEADLTVCVHEAYYGKLQRAVNVGDVAEIRGLSK
jgi:hypothetical protein